MSFFGFLLKKKFYISLGISLVLTILLILVVIISLNVYTRHGQAYIVPDLEGKLFNKLYEDEANRVFNFQITDSVYDNSLVPGSVIKQNPSSGSKAKEGRTIYLTVVSYTPKMSVVPELKDLTVRQAITTLKTNGLKVRELIFTPHFAGNSVLGQYYNGDTLLEGTELLEGSEIDLLVGRGDNQPSMVPFLIGLGREEARMELQMASFNVGKELYLDEPNPIHSKVYRQFPDWNEEIYPGDSVTLYFRSDLVFNFDSLYKELNPDTATYINEEDSGAVDESDLEQE